MLALLGAVAAFFALGLNRYLSLDAAKAAQAEIAQLYAARPAVVAGTFFVAYVAVTALSLPGAAIMTLLAGAVFG
ncbi:MAG: pyridine nucleotide-disulfide oxidoreductase, partial [Rubrivivax sp.]|nr:pyridine nucleotide-disulfide oxidoreductase [Rubrivivax sp.]